MKIIFRQQGRIFWLPLFLVPCILLSGFAGSIPEWAVQPPNGHDQILASAHYLQQPDHILFAVIGDYGLDGQAEADVASLVKSWNPDFIVTTGDNNYPNGSPSSIDQNIGRYFHEYIFPYSGSFGSGAASRRFFPVLGNHDWMSNGAKPYFDYFGFYNQRGYYEFVYGPAHFFMLDSDTREPDGVYSNSKQAKWLRDALASSNSPHNFIVMHHPPYSSGMHGSTNYMQWPYKAWGADVIFSGHDHLYERLSVDGLPYFVNGTGGSSLYPFLNILPESQIRDNQDFGAMRVEADMLNVKIQYYTRGGLLVDEISISDEAPFATSIQRVGNEITNKDQVDFTLTFSEAVSGLDILDFRTSAAGPMTTAVTAVQGSGNTYTISVSTGIGDGTLRLELLDNDTIQNSSGIPLGGVGSGNGDYVLGNGYLIDKTGPSMATITRRFQTPTNSDSVEFAVSFSEAVFGLDPTDFTVLSQSLINSEVTTVNGSGNEFVVAASTGMGDGTLGLTLSGNADFTDLAGNRFSLVSPPVQEEYFIDKTAPKVESISRSGLDLIHNTIRYSLIFSEPVSGVDSSDFMVTTEPTFGMSAIHVSGADASYFLDLVLESDIRAMQLDLLDNDSIRDISGNKLGGTGEFNGNYSFSDVYTKDTSPPIIKSIAPLSLNTSGSLKVDFQVLVSEAVQGVDAQDFTLYAPEFPFAQIDEIIGSGDSYRISVTTGSGNGMLRLDLTDNDSIQNVSGIPLGGVGLQNGDFKGTGYLIDRSPPQATSIIRASSNPSDATQVDFIVTFSEPVTGVDPQDFSVYALDILGASVLGIVDQNPFYIVTVGSGAGSGRLRLDLINNGTIQDQAGNKLGAESTGGGNFVTGEEFIIFRPSINFPPPSISGLPYPVLTNNPFPIQAWALVRGASFYEVQYASDANFPIILASRITPYTSHSLENPLGDGQYYWRVRAYNPEFQPGWYSDVRSFIIDTIPPPFPRLLSPEDEKRIFKNPVFTWEPVSEAVSYMIEVDDDPNFDSPNWTARRRRPDYQLSRIPKGIYYWRVQAKDNAGNWSAWSVPSSFLFR